jgi:dienelactone hydrolase
MQTTDEASSLRSFLRERCGLPEEHVPLNARQVGVVELPGIRIEKLIYDAEHGSSVPAHLYLPAEARDTMPAMVMAHGHGGSKSVFFNQYAGQLYARAGVAVLVGDPPGEEERDGQGRIGTRGHDRISEEAQRLGRPVVGKMAWDLMRGIDLLLERPEVDPARIGVAGHSLGAIVAAYLAALDERVRLALPAAMYFAPPEGEKFCTSGLYNLMAERIDYPALLGLGAPHCATLLLVGDNDPICRGAEVYRNEFHAAYREAHRRYAEAGASDRLARDVFPGAGHRPYFLSAEALMWVRRHFGLRWSDDDIHAVPAVRMDEWARENGVEFEDLYGTERHYAGHIVPDAGVRYLLPEKLTCLTPEELGRPEYTLEGWMQAIAKSPSPFTLSYNESPPARA